MKRKIAIIGIVWVCILICGCGIKWKNSTETGGENGTQKPDSPKTVLNWAVWDRESYPVWDALKDAYENKNPEIRIEIQDLGSLGYMKVLMNDLLSGEDYDIITTPSISDYVMLCQKKLLLPLDYYIKREKISISQYNTDAKNLKMNGKYYQLPYQNDFWLLFYNQDLFDRQRIAYPSNDMNLEEYQTLVSQMTSLESSKRIYGAYYHVWPSVVRVFGLLGEEEIPAFTDFSYLAPYYTMIMEQETAGNCQDYIDISTMGTNYAYAFSNGDIAMMPMGSWMIAELVGKQYQEEETYQKWNGKNWGIVRMPRNESRDPYEAVGSLRGLAIHGSTKYEEEAWEFVKFACGEEGAKIQAQYGHLPAYYTDEIREILMGIAFFPKDEASKEALEVHTIWDVDAVIGVGWKEKEKIRKSLPEIHTIWDEYHKKIMSENMNETEGLRELEEEIQALIQ